MSSASSSALMSIFNRRSEGVTTGGGSVAESGRISAKEKKPLSSMPVNAPEPNRMGGPASIGKAVKITGQIYSKEDLYVDGEVEGTIELQAHRLTIGANGKVRCNIKAREVVVLGNVQGKVDSTDKLEVRKNASVVGDITTVRIVIEDGAYVKGSIDTLKSEPAKSSAGLRSEPAVPTMLAAAPANSHSAAMVAE